MSYKYKRTIDYWLMMSCEAEDVNKWNKTDQNHIAKATILRRSWRTNE